MSAIEVSKNTLETIRFQVTEFKGKPYADIRVYHQDDNGEWKPSRKGPTISPEIWPEFTAAIQEIGVELRERRLLDHGGD